jgi:hypothetical protein
MKRLLLFLSLAWMIYGEESERVKQLEAKVQRLESLVKMIVDGQRRSGTLSDDSADFILRELGNEAPMPIAPPIPEPTSVASAPAKPVERVKPSAMPQELLPFLGKIGATTNFLAGAHSGPFGLKGGSFFGGSIELPLAKAPGGRLHYEISLGLARSTTQLPITSNVAQVANLAVLTTLNPNRPNNLTDGLSGSGAAPFPVVADAQWNMQLLQLVPFALKYVPTGLDRWRIRPYAAIGLGTYVTISNQATNLGLRPNADLSPELRSALQNLFGNGAPFGGNLIGGQITAARELQQRQIAQGQGGLDIGLHTGGGLEIRLRRGFSFGVDARWNRLSNGVNYSVISTKSGFHF